MARRKEHLNRVIEHGVARVASKEMAGTLGAFISWRPKIQDLSLFLYNNCPRSSEVLVLKLVSRKSSSVCFPFSRFLTMALADQPNNGLDIKEPSPKVRKLDQNGVHDVVQSFLRVKKLSDKAILPSRGSPLAAGYDLSSAVDTKVPARGKLLIPTDLSISIPEGTYGRVAPRSGLALKHSIDVGAGVIDADYRGPLGVILFNHSDVDFEVKEGDRIAQLIIEKIMTPDVLEVDDLDSTARGAGGFGSTGV